MRWRDREPFVPLGVDFCRTAYWAEVGASEVQVYAMMRHYTWRGSTFIPELQKLMGKNKLVANISQKHLMTLTKLTDKPLREKIKRLEDLGWIKVTTTQTGKNLYILGELVEGLETYFCDRKIAEWVEKKVGYAKAIKSYMDTENSFDEEGIRRNSVGGCGDTPQGGYGETPHVIDKGIIDKKEVDKVLCDSGESHSTVPTSPESGGSIGNDDVRSRIGQLVNKAEAVKKHAALRREVKIAKITVTPQKELTKESVVSFVDLWKFLRKATLENFKDQKEERFPMRMDGKNTSLMKLFIKDYGGKVAAEYVEWACKNWKKIIVKFKLNAEVPTVAILWGYRESFIPMIGKSVVVVGKNQDEYDAEQAKECPDAGWGQFAPESKGKDFANG